MNVPARAAFVLLVGLTLLSAGCSKTEEEADGVVPEGVSLEPTDEPFATGGVSLPADASVDTAQVTPPPGAPDTGAAADTAPR